MSEDKRCGTCAYAVFILTPTGRIKARKAGRCSAPIPNELVDMPACVKVETMKYAIWPDQYCECKVWMKKP